MYIWELNSQKYRLNAKNNSTYDYVLVYHRAEWKFKTKAKSQTVVKSLFTSGKF